MKTETNAPVWVLTKESMCSLEEVVTFTDLDEAQEALECLKDYYIENGISFKAGNEAIRNCEDAIVTDDGELYSVQSIEDAISPQGKLVWVLSHYVFGGDTEVFNWQKVFATEEEAMETYREILAGYQEQTADGITYEELETGVLIYKDDEPVVKMYGEPMIVGLVENVEIVDLNTI